MDIVKKKFLWFYEEFGLKSLRDTGRDAWLVIFCRSSRMLAYGCNSLILALFLSALDFSDVHIGIFMTLTLVGDVMLSGLLTLIADRMGRRRVLVGGSVMMILSGIAFAFFENFWILLFAAVVGVLSISGGDTGPFRAIEESIISHLTTTKTRSDVLSWYVVTASVGSAIGAEISGRLVHYLEHKDGWTLIDAYHAGFWLYTGMGILNLAVALLLSDRCEISETPKTEESGVLLDEVDGEGSPVQEAPSEKKPTSRFSRISQETRAIMYKLWFLLVVDSLADGMTGYSLTIYYMERVLDIAKSTLGDITSFSYVLAACSTIFAGPLAKRLGLINTMVFTHLPSSIAVLLFPIPGGTVVTVLMFFIRVGLNYMDQAPRSAFIAAAVKPNERTAVMGITNILRQLAAMSGPTVTGLLAGNERFWIAFVVAGSLRVAYDLGLWWMFVSMKVGEDEEEEQVTKTDAEE